MFILRQIVKNGLTSNQCLGRRYLVTHKAYQPEQFEALLKVTDHHPDSEKIFAILTYGDEKQDSYPLYTGFSYYIMTESGKTFDNLTFR